MSLFDRKKWLRVSFYNRMYEAVPLRNWKLWYLKFYKKSVCLYTWTSLLISIYFSFLHLVLYLHVYDDDEVISVIV